MDARPRREVEQIDRDLEVERRLLAYEQRSGRRSDGACATWRYIDQLLDERLVVQSLPDGAPRAVDGHVVP